MRIDPFQAGETLARWRSRERQRARNLRLIGENRLLEVDTPERVEKFLRRRGLGPAAAASLMREARRGSVAAEGVAEGGPAALERVLGSNDLIGVAFLERGLEVARAVGRIWIGLAAGRPEGYGTGFLVGPSLLLTNHHVLGEPRLAASSLVELDYQLGTDGRPLPSALFALDPATFFAADRHLDYALVAVQPVAAGGRPLREFGWCRLDPEEGKAIAAQWVNIVQHPNGEPKVLGLRENHLIDVLEEFLHYRTDTAPGSSGAPVFNDRWEVIGLHHSGVWATDPEGRILALDGQVWRPEMGEHRIRWIANEGARISRVVAHLRRQPLGGPQQAMVAEMLAALPPRPLGPGREQAPPPVPAPGLQPHIAADGAVTWTIPLAITVQLGLPAAPAPSPLSPLPLSPLPLPLPPAPSPPRPVPPGVPAGPEQVLAEARAALGGRPDLLDLRLGYVFRDGWITRERALVATVRRALPAEAPGMAGIEPLPASFRGLPVELADPSPWDLLARSRGPGTAEALLGERDLRPEEILYFPPAGAGLPMLRERMRVLAHASPEEGWPQLAGFLKGTRRRLVVGMYDFGAPHILDVLLEAAGAGGFRQLALVMQQGESVGGGTKALDLRDAEVVARLCEALGARFTHAWVRKGPVNGWIASSYHIKLAVRDRSAFWLSSGNWQSSNQPAGPRPAEPRDWLQLYNREWHAIVGHPGLARTLETYLLHDLEQNQGPAPVAAPALPELLVAPLPSPPAAGEQAAALRYFPPFEETRTFAVQPLLTPDNYHAAVLALVRGAERELLIQNQTFKAPKPGQERLRELVEAVLERQRRGVEVRIIFRSFFAADDRRNLEALQELGFAMSAFRLQPGCHTKGIVADRARVLLGSQNWSNDGVAVNRDASLLFEDAPLAAYFADLFEHDWQGLARPLLGGGLPPLGLVLPEEPAAAAALPLAWKDYEEML